jgi:2-polyprenyl-6-methoxyphenol hydroxylase-like FAD-dependent oxidoreductase
VAQEREHQGKANALSHIRSFVPDHKGDLLISESHFNNQFGKRLSNIEMTDSGPVAHFQDGTSEAGTVIIGADGNASFVRRWLLGDDAEPQTLPYAFMNFPVRYTAEQARYIDKTMHPIVDVGVHPKSMYIGLFLLDKPDLERPETWIFYILTSWPIATKEDEENTGNRLQRLRDRMDDWADPFKSAVAWVPDDTEIKPDKLKIWIPKPWDNRGGHVTIAGDAAHSMTFRK